MAEQEVMCLEGKRSAVLAKILYYRQCYSAGMLTCRFPGKKKCKENPFLFLFFFSYSDKHAPKDVEVVNFMCVNW